MQQEKHVQIAIDGPVAAGKGAVSQALADKLGILNVDTGAMYRTVALLALRHGLDMKDEEVLVDLLQQATIELRKPTGDEDDGRWNTVLLDGRDISEEIRKKEVGLNVAKVAALPKVREELVTRQQQLAANTSVVMEGRDIGTVVLPDATVKVYLDADVNVRARRRWLDRKDAGEEIEYDQILEQVKERDYLDSSRKVSPLARHKEAYYIDSTEMTIDEVVDEIAGLLHK